LLALLKLNSMVSVSNTMFADYFDSWMLGMR
jgi:hypothetical protein